MGFFISEVKPTANQSEVSNVYNDVDFNDVRNINQLF